MKVAMAVFGRIINRLTSDLRTNVFLKKIVLEDCRCLETRAASSVSNSNDGVEKLSKESASSIKKKQLDSRAAVAPLDYRFIYPEFLPDPKVEWRNAVREKLERLDMVNRRAHIDIAEFYVGSILAVTTSNPHAPGKSSRFVGICIQRKHCGLRATFILRNVIDHLGTEINYEMYNPTIQKIEVLRLEKRLDDELLYLRDALPEYSTFPFDMEPEILPEGASVPINDLKVKLKPRPWLERWERQSLQGLQDLGLADKFYVKAERHATPWEKYDLMKQYRATIPEEDQKEIFAEVYSELHQLEMTRKKMKRKRTFVKPKKTA